MKYNGHFKPIFKIAILFGICYFVVLPLANWYFGYHGYEKEKHRRNTWGDIEASKTRKAFVKKLHYTPYLTSDTINVDSLNIFIEKGFKYGFFSAGKTNFELGKTNYPFQISHTERANHNLVVYYFANLKKGDSIGEHRIIYLKTPKIKDTLLMTVESWRLEEGKAKWDSIGYIKVYQ